MLITARHRRRAGVSHKKRGRNKPPYKFGGYKKPNSQTDRSYKGTSKANLGLIPKISIFREILGILKLPQSRFGFGAAGFIILLLGLGLPMIIPSTPYNGLIIISLAFAVFLTFFFGVYVLYRKRHGKELSKKKMFPVYVINAIIIFAIIYLTQDASCHLVL